MIGTVRLLLLLTLADSPPQAATGAAPTSATPVVYRIGAKDLLEIRVLEIPELNVDRRVSDNGSIDVPLLGELPVSGLTAAEAKARLESVLTSKYVNRANVSIEIKEFGSKPITIVGAVRNPGSLRVSGRWSLLEAVSAAGGLTENAGRKVYVLRRRDAGNSETLEVSTEELFHGSGTRANISLVPGDVVNVPARRIVKVFCLGEVKSPGALEFDSEDRITLLSAIAKAGGLTDRASRTIRVKRRGPDGKDTELVARLGRILAGKDPDPDLKPDDVIIVKESFF